MAIKVLTVVTSHGDLGKTGNKTGWYLPEVSHPYDVFTKAGFEVDFVSPKGGDAPMDPGSAEAFKEDPVSQAFLKSGAEKLKKTMKPSDVDISKYKVIFYAGGHGPMFDLPNNEEIAKLCTKAYEGGAVVCAVCHGTVGLVPVKLSNGESIVKGQTITSFTNAEEEFVKLTEAMPFLLETRLKELGGNFVGAENFQANVQTSGRIVTGQNPPSAGPMAEKVVSLVKAA